MPAQRLLGRVPIFLPPAVARSRDTPPVLFHRCPGEIATPEKARGDIRLRPFRSALVRNARRGRFSYRDTTARGEMVIRTTFGGPLGFRALGFQLGGKTRITRRYSIPFAFFVFFETANGSNGRYLRCGRFSKVERLCGFLGNGEGFSTLYFVLVVFSTICKRM